MEDLNAEDHAGENGELFFKKLKLEVQFNTSAAVSGTFPEKDAHQAS